MSNLSEGVKAAFWKAPTDIKALPHVWMEASKEAWENSLSAALTAYDSEKEKAFGCESGCTALSGGERKHHKDCRNYPDSMSELLDNAVKESARLKEENEGLKSDRDALASNVRSREETIDKLRNIIFILSPPEGA
jgi:hypothetical protein